MQRFRKISALFLSVLVLLSSTSFTFNMHFCMGQIENIAFFKEAKACEMVAKSSPCTKEKHDQEYHQTHVTKKGCCEDRTVLVEGQDELAGTTSVAMPDIQFVAILYVAVSFLLPGPSVDTDSYKEYSPPLIERDIPVLVQSFLI